MANGSWNLKKALWGVLLVPFVLAAVWLWRLYYGIDTSLGVYPPAPQQLVLSEPHSDFVELEEVPAAEPPPAIPPVREWTDWRGPGRDGISPDVPAALPAQVKLLWKRGLTGPGLSGVTATASHVIVADKSERNDQDIWRCLDAQTGRELWTIVYPTPTEMEFTNAPRAAPVIRGLRRPVLCQHRRQPDRLAAEYPRGIRRQTACLGDVLHAAARR
jgi:hypothetical protein